jgi:hypothetical protein
MGLSYPSLLQKALELTPLGTSVASAWEITTPMGTSLPLLLRR